MKQFTMQFKNILMKETMVSFQRHSRVRFTIYDIRPANVEMLARKFEI